MNRLKELFQLDPEVIFLNHGSFGAVPLPVFEVYQAWQRRLEQQPVSFLARELNVLLQEARDALGQFLHADADDLVYIPNATYGINLLARSLDLQPADEVLATDHEYGACDYTWDFIIKKTGSIYRRQHISLPVKSAGEMVELLWQGVSERTRVIFMSHITSPTALRLPVEEICNRARQAEILTIIDAAHSPGQIDIDLQAIGADFVFGNCHKWMLSPKGAGFLYTRKDRQALVKPLVVSWGYDPVTAPNTGSRFVDLLQWTGTHDPSAYLSVPASIQFMNENHWDDVRHECHDLLRQAIHQICSLTDMPPLYPLDSDIYHQMGIAPLPASIDHIYFKNWLYDTYKIELPLIYWQGNLFCRISVQGYNTPSDIEKLVEAMTVYLSNQPH